MPYNKNGWTLWDMNYRGKRIEVKETGYYHSWRTDGKVSQQRGFGITKAMTYTGNDVKADKAHGKDRYWMLNAAWLF